MRQLSDSRQQAIEIKIAQKRQPAFLCLKETRNRKQFRESGIGFAALRRKLLRNFARKEMPKMEFALRQGQPTPHEVEFVPPFENGGENFS